MKGMIIMNIKKLLFLPLLAPLLLAGGVQLDSPALNKVCFQDPPTHDPLVFVSDGKANFVIVYDRQAERHLSSVAWKSIEPAVETLQSNLKESLGCAVETIDVSEVKNHKGKYLLLVGESTLTKELGINAGELPQEGFIVKSFPGGIAIVGNDSSIDPSFNTRGPMYMKGARKATLWGAYDFLERFFGCRFYYPGPDGSLHPKVSELELNPFCYTDAPRFLNRGAHYLMFSTEDAEKGGLGKLTGKDLRDYYASQRWSKSEPFTSMHSPYPEKWAKANPDKIDIAFFRNSTGHLYQSYTSHAANYFDVTNLKFADALIDSLKRFYESDGKDNQGWAYNNGYYIAFGQCDNELQLHEMQNNPVVKQEGLIGKANLEHGEGAYYSDIYGRFYRYLAERIRKEFPDKKLIIMPYASYTNAPFRKEFFLPDNVEAGVCLGKFPRWVMNPAVRKEYEEKMKNWYEALGNRPVQMIWTYNAGNNCFVQAIASELLGEVPKALGKYMGNTEIFHEFSMWPKPFPEMQHWHFYYATYVGMRAMWNPDFNVDAALDEHWNLFYGQKAGPHLKEFHRILKEAYFKYASPEQKSKALYPPKILDQMEECMKAAEKELPPGSVERRRYDLMSKAMKFELKSQRGQHAYNAPFYLVHRLPAGQSLSLDSNSDESFWNTVTPVPMMEPNGTGESPKYPADLRLVWSENGIYGRMLTNHPAKVGNKDMWRNSVAEFFFSPGLGKDIYYQICLDPENRISSMKKQLTPFLMTGDFDWKCHEFLSTSNANEKGWTLKFFLPFSGLGVTAPDAYQSWHFNFVYNKQSDPCETSSSSMCLGNNHDVSLYGTIKFLGKGE